MAILETILAIGGSAASINATIRDILKSSYDFDKLLAEKICEVFSDCKNEINEITGSQLIKFDQECMTKALRNSKETDIESSEELVKICLALLPDCIYIDSFDSQSANLAPTYLKIVNLGIEEFWKDISQFESLSNSILIKRTGEQKEMLNDIKEGIRNLSELASTYALPNFHRSTETAPPKVQEVNGKIFHNPFSLVRAEDFNHNYSKIAKVFEKTPEWEAFRSRHDNAILIGGRGTGKSMMLRRLAIQSTISYYKNSGKDKKLNEIEEDSFGIYIKLTRGTFSTYEKSKHIKEEQLDLLGQHEMNIKIFDAFLDSISWLEYNGSLSLSIPEIKSLYKELNYLITSETKDVSIDDLKLALKKELKNIRDFYKQAIFNQPHNYEGNATDCVSFISDLSEIFKRYFNKSNKEYRLLILIDEFEALTEKQQIAINTIMKSRLNDVTLKIGVRKDGIKTLKTLSENDPIQEPRDYISMNIEYNPNSPEYEELLKGICEKRLEDAGFANLDINAYLINPPFAVPEEKINEIILDLWKSSDKRRLKEPNQEFFTKYRKTALYRYYNKKRSFPYYGFKQYRFLSGGILSNFMELCRYTFYFAIYKGQDLHLHPPIDVKIQTHSIYYVSERLFDKVDSNVPKEGIRLKDFLLQLAHILRELLQHHTSETEANRITIEGMDQIKNPQGSLWSILKAAYTWSVIDLISPDRAMQPKNEFDLRNHEIVINPIYCPHLNISPASRWRVRISANDLEGLCNGKLSKVKKSHKAIIDKFFQPERNGHQAELFGGE